MNYLEQVTYMKPEMLLLAQVVLLILLDLFSGKTIKKQFDNIACGLFIVCSVISALPTNTGEAFGGMFTTTSMTPIVKAILNLGTILVFLQARVWANNEQTKHKRSEIYILTLSTLMGMNLMISAGHFLLFYLGLELASLPLTTLIAYNKYEETSIEAGAKFVLIAAFSSGMMLFGISLFYGAVGAEGLYFDSMSKLLSATPLQLLALVFFLSGLAFKISLVPFHLWTADVYQGAPTNVSAYLSVISKGAAVFALMFLTLKLFGNIFEYWQYIVAALIVLTITVGNLFAMRQTNVKRFLGFSSISQAGYIMLGMMGIGTGDPMGMTSVVFYLLVYLVSNIGIFAVVSVIENNSNKLTISDYNGLYKTNPYLSIAMMLFLFSLGGIPPFAGFFSKFFVFMSAANDGWYILDFIALINTVISLYYYLLIVKAMFINENENPIAAIKTDGTSKIGLAVCLAGTLALGVFSGVYTGLSQFAY